MASPQHQFEGSNATGKKRLLLQILDALTQLSDEDLDTKPGQRIMVGDTTLRRDKSPDVKPSSKEQRKIAGTEEFHAFRARIQDLDRENFRQFGSAGIIASSVQLRTRLAKVLFLFNLNASMLFFPYVTVEYPPETLTSWKMKSDPQELNLLADDLRTFLSYLHEFPALTHEPLVRRVLQFRQGLKVKNFDLRELVDLPDRQHWAVSLQEFQGDVRNPTAARYLHALCGEMDSYLKAITIEIGNFIEHVIPSIRVAQQRAETTLVSLSGLATFVSAVTATGIQITYDKTDGLLQNSVNAFWFSSLVFSVASAVNSLLGHVWTQSRYRSPQGRVPWWILIWIRQSPFFFLIAALVTFSIGLVLFTWASGQHFITCLLTTFFTGISLFSLSVVSVWFALERTVFVQSKGEQLLADAFAERPLVWGEYVLLEVILPAKAWCKKRGAHVLREVLKVVPLFQKVFPCVHRCGCIAGNHEDCDAQGDVLENCVGDPETAFSALPSPPHVHQRQNTVNRPFAFRLLEGGPRADSSRYTNHSPRTRLAPPGPPRSPYLSRSSDWFKELEAAETTLDA